MLCSATTSALSLSLSRKDPSQGSSLRGHQTTSGLARPAARFGRSGRVRAVMSGGGLRLQGPQGPQARTSSQDLERCWSVAGAEPRRRNEKKISGVCGSMNPARKIGLSGNNGSLPKLIRTSQTTVKRGAAQRFPRRPSQALAGPCRPPLPPLTVVRSCPPDVTVDRPLRRISTYSSQPRRRPPLGLTTTRLPTRRHEFLPPAARLDQSVSAPEFGAEMPPPPVRGRCSTQTQDVQGVAASWSLRRLISASMQ